MEQLSIHNIEAVPNNSTSRKISQNITEKLMGSLSSIVEYLKEHLDPHTFLKAQEKVSILNSSSPAFWVFSAINSKLCEAVINEQLPQALIYIQALARIDVGDFHNQQVVDFCIYNRFQKALFNHYPIEGHPTLNQYTPKSDEEIENTKALIHEAHKILQSSLPLFYTEIENYINTYVILHAHSIISGSSSHLLKSIYVRTFKEKDECSLILTCDGIIHEAAHMHLHFLSMYDPLVLNTLENKFTSPFRKDPRPMIGVFHAYFVMFRLILALQSESIRTTFKKSLDEVDALLFRYQTRFLDTRELIAKNAEFTDLGQKIFDETCMIA